MKPWTQGEVSAEQVTYMYVFTYTRRFGHAVRMKIQHVLKVDIGSTLASRKVVPSWATKRKSRKALKSTSSHASLTGRTMQTSTFCCRVVTIDVKNERHSEGKFSKSTDACSKTPTFGRAPRGTTKRSENGAVGKTHMKS